MYLIGTQSFRLFALPVFSTSLHGWSLLKLCGEQLPQAQRMARSHANLEITPRAVLARNDGILLFQPDLKVEVAAVKLQGNC